MDRYSIGQKVFELLLEFLVAVHQAQYLPPALKRASLEAISPNFDTVKILIRLARKLEIIDEKKYLALTQELQQIGRMLGGWIKTLPKQDA